MKEQELFPGLRRELVLEQEDMTTSEDPLERFLEKKGWGLDRARQLRTSAAIKQIPSIFTSKPDALSAAEKSLQADIEAYVEYRITLKIKKEA